MAGPGRSRPAAVALGLEVVDGTCEVATTNNTAQAWAVVGKGSLTVQEVRAINQKIDGAGIVIDLDENK